MNLCTETMVDERVWLIRSAGLMKSTVHIQLLVSALRFLQETRSGKGNHVVPPAPPPATPPAPPLNEALGVLVCGCSCIQYYSYNLQCLEQRNGLYVLTYKRYGHSQQVCMCARV